MNLEYNNACCYFLPPPSLSAVYFRTHYILSELSLLEKNIFTSWNNTFRSAAQSHSVSAEVDEVSASSEKPVTVTATCNNNKRKEAKKE